MRLKEGLPVREVALHMGAIHGVDKMRKLQQLHFWKPTAWKPSAGQYIIDQMVQVGRVSIILWSVASNSRRALFGFFGKGFLFSKGDPGLPDGPLDVLCASFFHQAMRFHLQGFSRLLAALKPHFQWACS